MKIQIKLVGMLKDRTPEGISLELPVNSTIENVLAQLDILSETIQAVSVNGSIERDKSRTLVDGDELVVLPPVGGG